MPEAARGSLWLVPNALDHGCDGPGPIDDMLPLGVLRVAAAVAHWRVEDARSARAFLKRVAAVVPLSRPLQQIDIAELPRPRKGTADPGPAHAADPAWARLLEPADAGADVALLSDAGLPAVADPGARLVAAAHAAGIAVRALPGPSSITLAVAASGLQGQSFAFVGYLPTDAAARRHRLLELESFSRRARQTQLFIETPYRNPALLAAMLECLAAPTRVAVSCGLTLAGGWTHSASVEQWRRSPRALPDRLPAVFALLAD